MSLVWTLQNILNMCSVIRDVCLQAQGQQQVESMGPAAKKLTLAKKPAANLGVKHKLGNKGLDPKTKSAADRDRGKKKREGEKTWENCEPEGAEHREDYSSRSRELRKALKSGLDKRMKYEVRDHKSGLQKTLTNEEMQAVHDRRQIHMAGIDRIKGWADKRGGLSPERGPPTAVAFWHDLTGSNKLPDDCILGLLSAVSTAKFTVVLVTYQKLTNVPLGIIIEDARALMAEQKFLDLLLAGVHVAVLADCIRFRAIAHRPVPAAWFIDCSALWLKPPPCLAESMYGHAFASMKGDIPGSIEQRMRWWLINYLKHQDDRLFLVSPFGFPKGSPILADMCTWFDEVFSGDRLHMTNISAHSVLMHLRTRITHWGLEDCIIANYAFSPLDCIRNKICTEKADDSEVKTIIRDSYCVNNFWEQVSMSHVKIDSVWGRLYQHVCPTEFQALKESRSIAEDSASHACLDWPFEYSVQMCDSMAAFHSTPVFRRYELLSQIGSGSYGSVYKAQHRRGGDRPLVAVKVVHSKSVNSPVDTRELFFMLSLRDSPNVVHVIDGWMSPWITVTVMDLAQSDLHHFMTQTKSRMPLGLVIPLFQDIARGLSHIHKAKLIHRDVHAGNVMLYSGDTRLTAKVGDLGMACGIPESEKAERLGLTQGVTAVKVRAPEIFFCQGAEYDSQGKYCGIDRCTYGTSLDIWSLGVLFLTLDLGENPFYKCSKKVSEAVVAKTLITQWGMPFEGLRRRLRWSFKGLRLTGMEPWGMAQEIRKKSRMLPWTLSMLIYDPADRTTASCMASLIPDSEKLLEA